MENKNSDKLKSYVQINIAEIRNELLKEFSLKYQRDIKAKINLSSKIHPTVEDLKYKLHKYKGKTLSSKQKLNVKKNFKEKRERGI